MDTLPYAKLHQTTNLGVRSSNLFGRANKIRNFAPDNLPRKRVRADHGQIGTGRVEASAAAPAASTVSGPAARGGCGYALYAAIICLIFSIDAIDLDLSVLRDGTLFFSKFSSK